MSLSSSWRPTPAMGDPLLLAGDELLLLSARPPNLLLEGPTPRVDAVVAALTPHLSRPLTAWRGGALPDERRGTLIVPEVHRLDDMQQRQLMRWLDDAIGRVHVIATAAGTLFPLVERGAFLDALYYRLNVVRVEVPA